MNQLHIHLVSGDSGTGRFIYNIDSIQEDGTRLRLHVMSHHALIYNLHKVYGLKRATAVRIEQMTWQDTVVVDMTNKTVSLKHAIAS